MTDAVIRPTVTGAASQVDFRANDSVDTLTTISASPTEPANNAAAATGTTVDSTTNNLVDTPAVPADTPTATTNGPGKGLTANSESPVKNLTGTSDSSVDVLTPTSSGLVTGIADRFADCGTPLDSSTPTTLGEQGLGDTTLQAQPEVYVVVITLFVVVLLM